MRRRVSAFFKTAFLITAILSAAFAVDAQNRNNRRSGGAQGGAETISGTVMLYGTGANTRTYVMPFQLRLTGRTPREEVTDLLGTLQEGGQDDLLERIDDRDLGSFTINNRIGPRINFVHEDTIDGQRRLFVAFARWMEFAELRGGYRSTDYPFGVFEIYIDPQTGRGTGTYIPAAQVRWRTDRRSGQGRVEIENFATYPGRLMGVRSSQRS